MKSAKRKQTATSTSKSPSESDSGVPPRGPITGVVYESRSGESIRSTGSEHNAAGDGRRPRRGRGSSGRHHRIGLRWLKPPSPMARCDRRQRASEKARNKGKESIRVVFIKTAKRRRQMTPSSSKITIPPPKAPLYDGLFRHAIIRPYLNPPLTPSPHLSLLECCGRDGDLTPPRLDTTRGTNGRVASHSSRPESTTEVVDDGRLDGYSHPSDHDEALGAVRCFYLKSLMNSYPMNNSIVK
ncbi:hypothetical protein BHE74_00029718 [Ensete ventricosum]|nr:hypothetical protein BHE74_00029718 [Ensete ventricosum]